MGRHQLMWQGRGHQLLDVPAQAASRGLNHPSIPASRHAACLTGWGRSRQDRQPLEAAAPHFEQGLSPYQVARDSMDCPQSCFHRSALVSMGPEQLQQPVYAGIGISIVVEWPVLAIKGFFRGFASRDMDANLLAAGLQAGNGIQTEAMLWTHAKGTLPAARGCGAAKAVSAGVQQ